MIKNKNHGVMPEPPIKHTDHFLGAGDSAPIITNAPFTFWLNEILKSKNTFQKDKDGRDLNSCLPMSVVDGYQYYFNYMMTVDNTVRPILSLLGCLDENGKADFSDIFTAVMSNTDPNNGNNVTTVCESIREVGLLGNKFLPWDNTKMTKAEFYDRSKITEEMKTQAKKILMYFDLRHAWIGGSVGEQYELAEAWKKGVVRVSVDGSDYDVDKNGNIYICNGYTHSIVTIGGVQNVNTICRDHYNNQFPKFSPKYPFGNPKLLYVLKNNMDNVLTHDKIRVDRTILFLAKSGPYAGLYMGYYSSEIYKSINGEFKKTDWVQDPLGAGVMPSNVARDGDGNIICIGLFAVGKQGSTVIEGTKIEDVNLDNI